MLNIAFNTPFEFECIKDGLRNRKKKKKKFNNINVIIHNADETSFALTIVKNWDNERLITLISNSDQN